MAVNPNTNFTAGQILTADQTNRFPRGVMGYVISTGNHSVTTATADVTGMSITFTAVANRLYKATFSGFYSQSDALSRLELYLTDGSNTGQNNIQRTIPNNGGLSSVSHAFIFTASAGSITRKIRTNVSGGTATIFGNPADSRTYSFVIEDLGPV
jgi:hypothetical protein